MWTWSKSPYVTTPLFHHLHLSNAFLASRDLRPTLFLYTPWSIKNKTPNYCPYLRQILTDFQNSFTDTLSRKFAIKILLQIPPHLNMRRYTTLRNISLQKSQRLKAHQRQTRRAPHCVPKNDTDVTHYRFNLHQPISVIFGRDVAERVCYWMMIYYPTCPN